MTNHWIDIRNADRIIIMGSNAAENHPVSFKWVTEAMNRGGKLISVDPRYTRTSSKADIYAPIRSGTDIAFMGGMIRYILNDMQTKTPAERMQTYNMTYLAQYTNAALIINSDYEGPNDSSHPGLFVGYTENIANPPGRLGSYDKTKWKYGDVTEPRVEQHIVDNDWAAWGDLNETSVLRLLWEHYSRYTLDKVNQITGCPVADLQEVYGTYVESGAPGMAGTIMYAMGTTQHTHGTQNIRTYAIVQLLLGNVGVAGGGINALRGTSNVQGSTDMCLLWHILPGYLAQPKHTDASLDAYITRAQGSKAIVTPQNATTDSNGDGLSGDRSASWWWYDTTDPYVEGGDNSNYRKYIVSLLTAWYGKDNVQNEDPGVNPASTVFNYLPKVTGGDDYSHIGVFEAVDAGIIKGMMCWGQNPAVGGPDSEGERNALEKLDWLVVTDLFDTETASFWSRPEVDPTSIDTEVYLLPAACSYEKQGSISNSGRWAQWRYKALDPLGKAKPDLVIMDLLVEKLKDLYEADTSAPNRAAITELAWDYRHIGFENAREADPNAVALEINGYDMDGTKTPVKNFVSLKTDGSTCSGNWLYCGMFDRDTGENKAEQHDPVDNSLNQIGLYSGWTWCWPINRRIIYNRASVDLNGNPWDRTHPVIKYLANSHNSQNNKCTWLGDIADGPWSPIDVSLADGKDAFLPFIMHPEGVGKIWGPGRAEGPLPEVYEPWESPLDRNLMTNVLNNPSHNGNKGTPGFNNPCCYVGYLGGDNAKGTNTGYPCVGMTYRVSEMWQAGQMTRNHPWLNELQPEVFAELGEELAEDKNIKAGDDVKVSTARGYVLAKAVVTKRLKRLTVNGEPLDQVGIPWHWGFRGLSSAPHSSGNILTPHVGDANTTIPEYKTFLCKIEKV